MAEKRALFTLIVEHFDGDREKAKRWWLGNRTGFRGVNPYRMVKPDRSDPVWKAVMRELQDR